MAGIDVESLLQAISPESPCGEDLSYDQGYLELERLSQGTPERQVGEQILAAEEPNWGEVRKRGIELLSRTKDLRVAVCVALGALRLEGMPGLRDGLALLRGLLERFWDHVYPQLDPEDEYDPLERINIIASLAQPLGTYQDQMMFVQRVREAPLCSSRRLGQFSLRDILIATGELSAPSGMDSPPEMSVISGAFQDVDVSELQATSQAVDASIEHLQAIDTFLTEKVGASRAPNLEALSSVLASVRKHLSVHMAERGIGEAPPERASGAPAGDQAEGPRPISGEIRSPQDVINVLQKVCQYFERNEPSSPVPLLLRRAQRLVSKDFLQIIQDLSPEAMRQIEVIGGIDSSTPSE